jgi:hypothetical protein
MLEQLRASLAVRLPADRGSPFARIARERLRIRTVDNRIIPFELRPIQRRYLARKRLARIQGRPPRFVLLKYRRGGFTTVEQALSYFMASGSRNVRVMTLAQDGDQSSKIFGIARLMHERDHKAPAIRGPGNQYKLSFPGLNSEFFIGTAAGHALARGDTLSRVHWSEVAWSCPGYNRTQKQRQLLAGLTEAASHGEIVMESTPNGSDLFREYYVAAKQNKNDWTAIFLRWFDDELNRLPVSGVDEAVSIMESLDDEESELVAKHRLDAEQIKFRRAKKRELKHLFYQEYPEDDETCWLTSGISFFSAQLTIRLKDSLCPSPELQWDEDLGPIPIGARRIPSGYEMEWEPPQPGVEYCLGADTSEGLPDSDPNGLGIMRKDNGRQVFAVHGLFTPLELAKHIVSAARYYSPCLIGIERESYGHAVLQKVMEHPGFDAPHYDGGCIYFHGSMTYSTRDEQVPGRAGYTTNSITRPLMLSNLRDWYEAEDPADRVRDRHMLEEMGTFHKQGGGPGDYDHDSGCHDDTIFKWGIANMMRLVDWRRITAYQAKASRWG